MKPLYNKTRHIDLTLPQGWNRCTLSQLRLISRVMIDCQARATRFRPLDMLDVKVAVFMALAGIQIVHPLNPRVPVEQQYYVCRLLPYTLDDGLLRRRWLLLKAWCRRNILGIDEDFSLYLENIVGWLMPEKKKNGTVVPGMLDWLDADSPDNLLMFPFKEMKRNGVLWHGPQALMNGFTWQRFRFAQDYMDMYVRAANAFVKMERMGKRVSRNDMLKAMKQVDLYKSMFLATIMERKVTYVDEESGRVVTDFRYQSNQHSDNAIAFRHFPDEDWQLVLMWWSGQLHWLGKTYRRVFKKQTTKPDKRHPQPNPLEVYTRTTATMEKYLGITARDVDREPYTTILQQLEDISVHNEEMEKIKRKNKSK